MSLQDRSRHTSPASQSLSLRTPSNTKNSTYYDRSRSVSPYSNVGRKSPRQQSPTPLNASKRSQKRGNSPFTMRDYASPSQLSSKASTPSVTNRSPSPFNSYSRMRDSNPKERLQSTEPLLSDSIHPLLRENSEDLMQLEQGFRLLYNQISHRQLRRRDDNLLSRVFKIWKQYTVLRRNHRDSHHNIVQFKFSTGFQVFCLFKWMSLYKATSLKTLDYSDEAKTSSDRASLQSKGNDSGQQSLVNRLRHRFRSYTLRHFDLPSTSFPLYIHALALLDAYWMKSIFAAWRHTTSIHKSQASIVKKMNKRRLMERWIKRTLTEVTATRTMTKAISSARNVTLSHSLRLFNILKQRIRCKNIVKQSIKDVLKQRAVQVWTLSATRLRNRRNAIKIAGKYIFRTYFDRWNQYQTYLRIATNHSWALERFLLKTKRRFMTRLRHRSGSSGRRASNVLLASINCYYYRTLLHSKVYIWVQYLNRRRRCRRSRNLSSTLQQYRIKSNRKRLFLIWKNHFLTIIRKRNIKEELVRAAISQSLTRLAYGIFKSWHRKTCSNLGMRKLIQVIYPCVRSYWLQNSMNIWKKHTWASVIVICVQKLWRGYATRWGKLSDRQTSLFIRNMLGSHRRRSHRIEVSHVPRCYEFNGKIVYPLGDYMRWYRQTRRQSRKMSIYYIKRHIFHSWIIFNAMERNRQQRSISDTLMQRFYRQWRRYQLLRRSFDYMPSIAENHYESKQKIHLLRRLAHKSWLKKRQYVAEEVLRCWRKKQCLDRLRGYLIYRRYFRLSRQRGCLGYLFRYLKIWMHYTQRLKRYHSREMARHDVIFASVYQDVRPGLVLHLRRSKPSEAAGLPNINLDKENPRYRKYLKCYDSRRLSTQEAFLSWSEYIRQRVKAKALTDRYLKNKHKRIAKKTIMFLHHRAEKKHIQMNTLKYFFQIQRKKFYREAFDLWTKYLKQRKLKLYTLWDRKNWGRTSTNSSNKVSQSKRSRKVKGGITVMVKRLRWMMANCIAKLKRHAIHQRKKRERVSNLLSQVNLSNLYPNIHLYENLSQSQGTMNRPSDNQPETILDEKDTDHSDRFEEIVTRQDNQRIYEGMRSMRSNRNGYLADPRLFDDHSYSSDVRGDEIDQNIVDDNRSIQSTISNQSVSRPSHLGDNPKIFRPMGNQSSTHSNPLKSKMTYKSMQRVRFPVSKMILDLMKPKEKPMDQSWDPIESASRSVAFIQHMTCRSLFIGFHNIRHRLIVSGYLRVLSKDSMTHHQNKMMRKLWDYWMGYHKMKKSFHTIKRRFLLRHLFDLWHQSHCFEVSSRERIKSFQWKCKKRFAREIFTAWKGYSQRILQYNRLSDEVACKNQRYLKRYRLYQWIHSFGISIERKKVIQVISRTHDRIKRVHWSRWMILMRIRSIQKLTLLQRVFDAWQQQVSPFLIISYPLTLYDAAIPHS